MKKEEGKYNRSGAKSDDRKDKWIKKEKFG